MQREVYEFISKKTGDPIVERRLCRWTGEEFPVYKSERKLLDSISPVIDGKPYTIPSPDLSPKARNIHRMLFRNDRVFYK